MNHPAGTLSVGKAAREAIGFWKREEEEGYQIEFESK